MDFSTRIAKLKNELTALKTATTKSATVLKTKTANGHITMPLHLQRSHGSVGAVSTQRALITLTNSDGERFLSMMTINITDANSRHLAVMRRVMNDGVIQFTVVATGSSDDFNTLYNGGSVTLDYDFTVAATSDFSLSVGYEDYDPLF